MLFFSKRQGLGFLRECDVPCQIRSYPNVDQFIGEIVASGKATLKELKTVYTLEDAYDLYEIIAVNKYNEWKLMEYYSKQAKKGRK